MSIKQIYKDYQAESIGFMATIGIIILMFWIMNYLEWHVISVWSGYEPTTDDIAFGCGKGTFYQKYTNSCELV